MQHKALPTKLSSSFVLCLVLTGYSSVDNSNLQTDSVSEQPSATIGTNGELIYIQSDNVSAAGYDEVSMVMTVQFDRGAIYEYYGVPPELWTSFVAAQPHPWSQVGYPRLVQGAIPYKRIV
jgi:hypothetical protein